MIFMTSDFYGLGGTRSKKAMPGGITQVYLILVPLLFGVLSGGP